MIQSETIRFLFDPLVGGPPRAFECRLDVDVEEECPCGGEQVCGKITKTLRGMRTHQLLVHGFKPQSEIFSEKEHI